MANQFTSRFDAVLPRWKIWSCSPVGSSWGFRRPIGDRNTWGRADDCFNGSHQFRERNRCIAKWSRSVFSSYRSIDVIWSRAFVVDSSVNLGLDIAKYLGMLTQSIYRNLDQDSGNERVMRLFFWEGAARRSQQEGSVLVVASRNPSVISALTFWNPRERSRSVIITTLS